MCKQLWRAGSSTGVENGAEEKDTLGEEKGPVGGWREGLQCGGGLFRRDLCTWRQGCCWTITEPCCR